MLNGVLIGVLLAAEASLTPAHAFRAFSRSSHRGLPQSTPIHLAQDREGRLWIGTFGGVGTYDGREIVTVSGPAPAPGYGVVNALVARRQGGVYVAGGGGVHVYDGESWRFVATDRAPRSLAEAGDGTLWMRDSAGAVWLLGAGDAWTHRTDLDGVALLANDRDDAVLAVHPDRGLLRLRDGRVEPLVAGRLPPGSLPDALRAAADGTYWLAGPDGVFWSAGEEEWRAVDVPEGTAVLKRVLAEDTQGRIWVGGQDGGVAFGRAEGAWTGWGPEVGLPVGALRVILGDREGSVWFGFNGVGLRQWLGEAWTHRRALRGPGGLDSRLPVFTVTADHSGEGVLAVAFTQGILHYAGGEVRTFGAAEGLDESVQSAAEPEPGRLWVGGRFGIWESLDGGRFHRTLELENGLVTGLFEDPSGDWWAATSNWGAYRFREGRWSPVPEVDERLEDPNVRSLAWLSDGSFWVATPRGLTVFRDGRGEKLAAPGLIEAANAVVETPGGEVWVGGVGGVSIRRDGVWSTMTADDGVPGHTVYSLAVGPDGAVWAGGSAGVGRHRDGRWQVWDSSSGLLEEECNLGGLLVREDGSVYVGTMASLAHLDPEVQASPAPPLRLSWRERPALDGEGVARLAAGTRVLRLRWAAPWLAPSPVEFRTRVPGLRDEWSRPSARDEMELANPPPGRFQVEVSARLVGRDEWTDPLVLEVDVERRLYQTWYGQLAMLAALGLGVFGLIRFRTLDLRRAADEALANVKVLSGLLPICASCKKVRDDKGYWSQLESYVSARSEAQFSHGLCPDCLPRYFGEYAERVRREE